MKKRNEPNADTPLTNEEWENLGATMQGLDGLPSGAKQAIKNARGRPIAENPKQPVSIRLDTEVIEAFKKDGAGWQTRINEVLKDWVGTH